MDVKTWMSGDVNTSPLVRYAVGIAAVGVACVAKLAVTPFLDQDAPFLLFFGTVMLASWFSGLGPGILATILAAGAGAYFFMHPHYNFRVQNPTQRLQLILFLVEGGFISFAISVLHRSRRRADTATAQARELEQKLLEVSDAERRNIGHDLHDGLGQHLTGTAFMSRLLARHLEARQVPDASDAYKIEDMLNQAVKWTRNLAAGLSPVSQTRDALPAALAELAGRTEGMFRIPCHFTGEPNAGVSSAEHAAHLYHIAQEAVSNAARHAKPARIRLTFAAAGGSETGIILTIEDDGRGIPDIHANSGMGLRTMAYRARLIGARLDVRRSAVGGTIVTCHYAPQHDQRP